MLRIALAFIAAAALSACAKIGGINPDATAYYKANYAALEAPY